MGEENITRGEIEERFRRVEDENNRQNRRLEKLEDLMTKINDLTVSVRELATSMKQMQQEQERQGHRLDSLEKEPADKWRTVVKTVITVLISAAVTYLITNGGI